MFTYVHDTSAERLTLPNLTQLMFQNVYSECLFEKRFGTAEYNIEISAIHD